MRSWQHELRLALQPGTAALATAELAPADVDLADIVAAAGHHARPLGFVVREVHARLAAHLGGSTGEDTLLCPCPRRNLALSVHSAVPCR